MASRKELRDKIFTENKRKSKIIPFFGVDVEVRQPTTGEVLQLRETGRDDPRTAGMLAIISYVYVPGTNEKMFEPADVDSLLDLPFGQDMSLLHRTISELSDIDVPGLEKNFEVTPTE